MSNVVLRRLPRPAGETARRYRVQRGDGMKSVVLGYIEELDGGCWQTVNSFRPKTQRVVKPYASCKPAIRALEQAADEHESAAA